MRTDKIRKYLIPNIPYLFILWACLKLGTAYRKSAAAVTPLALICRLLQRLFPLAEKPFYCWEHNYNEMEHSA